MVIGVNFHRFRDNSKNTGVIISKFFVGTLGTLGQHDFAFGFCCSVGVEISRVRKKWVVVWDSCFIAECRWTTCE